MYIPFPRKSFDEQQTCGINANSTMFNKFLQNGTFYEKLDKIQKHHSNVVFITFAGCAEMISRGFSIVRSASARLRYSCERAFQCCILTARAHYGWPNLCLNK